jgi:hypothetical protein
LRAKEQHAAHRSALAAETWSLAGARIGGGVLARRR